MRKLDTKAKIAIVIGIFILAVIGRFLYSYVSGYFMGVYMKNAMIPKVVMGEIEEAEVSNTIEAPGRIVATKSVDLVARINGYLQKKHYKDGDFVKKGQVLFTIEPQEYAIELQKAQASVKSAQAELKKSEINYKRAAELVKQDYISKATYDDRLAQRDISRANLQSAIALLNDAKRNYSYTRIVSPIDGKIGNINITEGNYVTSQSGALAKVVSMNPIYVLYSMDSKQFNELRNDTILPTVKQAKPIKVELTLTNGTIYNQTGEEDFYGNEISQTTGTIDLRATFKNPDNILIPGDFVRVKIYSNTIKKEIIVPQSATLQDSSGKYVFAVDENNKAKVKRISTKGQYETNWIVTKGLNKGDKIITKGALKARNGQPVVIVTQEEYEKLQDEGDESVSTKSEEEDN